MCTGLGDTLTLNLGLPPGPPGYSKANVRGDYKKEKNLVAKKRSDGPRDVQNIANRRLLAPRIPTIQTPRIRLTPDLRLVEDRRTWHPDGNLYRPVRAINSQRPRLKPVAFSSPKFKNVIPTALGFEVPKKVAICVRRKQRKEVLFAKRKTGRGSARPKRNQWSDITC